MTFDEKKFSSAAKPHILRCRDGDWNHALRVVRWVRKIGKGREDLPLLITAAYIHDIGWRNVLPPGRISFEELKKFEETANQNSEPFASDFLRNLGYSRKEINTVNRLIRAADQHRSQTEDESILVDADNLSKLAIDHLKEKYQKAEWPKIYRLWVNDFPKRIKTARGKRIYPALLRKLGDSVEKSSKVA